MPCILLFLLLHVHSPKIILLSYLYFILCEMPFALLLLLLLSLFAILVVTLFIAGLNPVLLHTKDINNNKIKIGFI